LNQNEKQFNIRNVKNSLGVDAGKSVDTTSLCGKDFWMHSGL